MFILIYKIFTFDFYHASEIAFFGNTAQWKRTLGDLHVSMRSRLSRPYDGWHAKRRVGTQNEGWHTKRWGGTQNEGWHTKRWVARKTKGLHAKRRGGTQNDGVAHKTMGVGN